MKDLGHLQQILLCWRADSTEKCQGRGTLGSQEEGVRSWGQISESPQYLKPIEVQTTQKQAGSLPEFSLAVEDKSGSVKVYY